LTVVTEKNGANTRNLEGACAAAPIKDLAEAKGEKKRKKKLLS